MPVSRNADFLSRYLGLERRVNAMERRMRPYYETIIVGGSFTTETVVPPFFAPFGGEIVGMRSRVESGNATILLEQNGDEIMQQTITVPLLVYTQELTTAVTVEEGDLIGVEIFAASGASGLSCGVLIEF